jgi:hypothetical protein
MKPISENNSQNNQNKHQKQPNPLILAVAIAGILVWEMYPALIHTAAANAGALKHSLAQWESPQQQTAPQLPPQALQKTINSRLAINTQASESGNFLAADTRQNPPSQLPATVAAAVRQELSRHSGIAASKLKVTESSRQSWPNSCLGLAQAEEICAQMFVEGWRVVLSDGSQTWVYRTNTRGNVLRLEKKAS